MKLNKTQKSIIAALCILLAVILITLGVLLVKKQKQKSPAEAQDTRPAQTAAQRTETQNADASGTETDAVTSTVTETQTQTADAPTTAVIGRDVSHSLPADFAFSFVINDPAEKLSFPMTLNDWLEKGWVYFEYRDDPEPEPGKELTLTYHLDYMGWERAVELTMNVPLDYSEASGLGAAEVIRVVIHCIDQNSAESYYRGTQFTGNEFNTVLGLLGEPDEERMQSDEYKEWNDYYYYGENAVLIFSVYDVRIGVIDYRFLGN